MSQSIAVIEGTIRPDGTLELPGKVNLPAGKVQVTLVPLPELAGTDPFWQLVEGIWAGQSARGHVPRGAHEVESERRLAREQWDERLARIALVQEAAERLRSGGQAG
jgi:hypothetical protein